ncbi:DNA polymerase III subunit gamma/tau [Halonatronum saccharophilum]|uniref:DNA polymerase III subunit gamma/tau n=1 Tax=Halonatronum saccharophilum TaxID=150060 RepID=UPI000481F3DB|nr:DNA polymerase III subunit gamma/tau [Halonatronum saccharophilum]
MAYVSLYRKWRPQDFSDIAGQKNIIKTLENAIRMDRIAHAYLFCGSRGTGKTSTAKILAKALNCTEGPTTLPCGDCEPCKKIKNNNSIDVIEIDAASNRGIDEIRDLRDKVKFAPTEGNYKVYIIDEVHMLTTEAFNALLKTLEEPPGYVIFVLATTEPHKLLPTILSRCQRFDFSKLTIEDIIQRLDYICKKEGITISNEGLKVIARNADGGMRDAISILDQVISFAGENIEEKDVSVVLGLVDRELLFDLTDILIEKNIDQGLALINNIVREGKNATQFINDLINHLRNLLLIKECSSVDKLIDLTDDDKVRLDKQVDEVTSQRLLNWVDILKKVGYDLKRTSQPRVILEMGIIKLINIDKDRSMDSFLDRLTQLEDKIKEGKIQVSDSNNNKKVEESQKPENDQANPKTQLEENKVVRIKSPADLKLEDVKERWEDILDYFRQQKKMRLQALLRDAEPISIDGNKLIIAFEHEFHKDSVQREKDSVASVLKKFLGVSLKVNCIFSGNNEDVGSEDDILDHPLVQEVVRVFNGEVVKVSSLD